MNPGLLKIRHSHRFVTVVIQFLKLEGSDFSPFLNTPNIRWRVSIWMVQLPGINGGLIKCC